ncbi:MAG: hypothetical protein EBR82_16080 [Caulobacteraceae bacterium]|nr:hypothetical protein [Caulobacteraceae bacterium]
MGGGGDDLLPDRYGYSSPPLSLPDLHRLDFASPSASRRPGRAHSLRSRRRFGSPAERAP